MAESAAAAATGGGAAPGTGPKRQPRVAILLCDMQEPFRNRIDGFELISKTIQKVLKAAAVLGMPVITTVQNPERLGPTIPELAALLPDQARFPVLPKTSFSMFKTPGLADRFRSSVETAAATDDGRAGGTGPSWTVAIVGIEAHVCVAQTAADFQRAGYRTVVLADAVGSCNPGEVGLALRRLGGSRRPTPDGSGNIGAPEIAVTSSEAFLFEVMGDAAIPEFRDVLKVIKEAGEDTKAAMARVDRFL